MEDGQKSLGVVSWCSETKRASQALRTGRRTKTMGLVVVVVWILAEDYGFDG